MLVRVLSPELSSSAAENTWVGQNDGHDSLGRVDLQPCRAEAEVLALHAHVLDGSLWSAITSLDNNYVTKEMKSLASNPRQRECCTSSEHREAVWHSQPL